MENNFFSVSNADLALLTPEKAVGLVTELLWAEATRLGVPIGKIHVSSNVNVSDQGGDAQVTDSLVNGELIKAGHTLYQIKSGKTFKPHRQATIRGELFGKHKKPVKKNLKQRIKKCLDEGGTYILVCTGVDLVDRSAVETRLKKFFEDCGYKKVSFEVWMQNQLRGLINQYYPSIALRYNGRNGIRLRSHSNWAGDAEMGRRFQPSTAQTKLISDFQTALSQSEAAVHIHLRGEAGIGKTRLVMEATQAQEFCPLILYTNKPSEFLSGDLMTMLTREDNQFAAIVVIDECSREYRTQIWDLLKSRGQKIKLVTIFNERDDASGVSFFDAPLLEQETIVKIIESYSVSKDQAERFADMCSGSPRVAHVIGWNLKNNPENLLRLPSTLNIWDRYVIGGDSSESQNVKERVAVLQHIALFKRFGYDEPLVQEAKEISAIIEKSYPIITWARFREIINELREHRILQGETTLYITPRALHIKLWADWWEVHGIGFDLEDFLKKIPLSLQKWFLEMFKYAEQSQVACRVVTRLLGPTGTFRDKKFFNTNLGGNFFLALTEVEPKEALFCLQRTIGTWTQKQLLKFAAGRREVVWALDKIAVWEGLFCDTARLLLKLATAENESWTNNATGVFCGLFSTGPGEVAPTEASPQERFPILQEALTSQSTVIRDIGLKACENALESRHFSRMVGAEHQGFKPKAKLWTPKTYDEIYDAYQRVWNLLRERLPHLPIKQRQQAIKTLFAQGTGLMLTTNFGFLIWETWKEIFENRWTTKPEILRHIISLLHYHRNELLPEVLKIAEAFRDELVGNDFSSLLKRYVSMDLLEDKFDEQHKRTDNLEKQIFTLAQQCISQPRLLWPELRWLVTEEAKNGYRFGYELGKSDKDNLLLKRLLMAQRRPTQHKSAFFLGGYLRALFEANSQKWERILDQLSCDKSLRYFVPELTWRSGMTDRAALRLLKLAKEGHIETPQFGRFCLGSSIKDISEDVLKKWITFLLTQPSVGGVRISLDLINFYYLHANLKKKLPIGLTLRILTHKSFFKDGTRFDTMERHYWTKVGKAFVSNYPKESLKLAQVIIEYFGKEETILGGFYSPTHAVLLEITRQNPEKIWDLVSNRLGPPIDSRAHHLKTWLHGGEFSVGGKDGVLPLIPLSAIWKWVDKAPKKRAWYLATFVPQRLFHSADKLCLAREVLIRYGEDPDVRRNLECNFSSESWSGPASIHYQKKKDWLLEFKKHEMETNVNSWIGEYARFLDGDIKRAKIEEERRGY